MATRTKGDTAGALADFNDAGVRLGPSIRASMHEVAQKGYLEHLPRLLKTYPELVNARDQNGRTPLHWTAVCGRAEVAAFFSTRNTPSK